ncbi:MAG: hypothetical protein IT208_04415 [Chthonomonadales bacterium]|nr:hypothetical protein [Chthonomonadales bacterium]
MDDMRELVTTRQVEAAFRAIAIAAPLLGALVGAALGRRSWRSSLPRGFLLGLLGPANLLLWWLYNAITDRMGLDTVRNLLVNMAMFVAIGGTVGLVLAWSERARRHRSGADGSAGEAGPVRSSGSE